MTATNREVQLSKTTKYIFRPNSITHSSQIGLQGLVYLLTNRMMETPTTRRENIVIRVNHYENEIDVDNSVSLINDTTLKEIIEKTN